MEMKRKYGMKSSCVGGRGGDLSVQAGVGREESSALPLANTRGYQTIVKTEDGTAGCDVYSDVITE